MSKNKKKCKSEKSGPETGFSLIDEEFGGLKKKKITIIGGRPAMGKTCLALNIALHVALKGNRVFYLSAEQDEAKMKEKLRSMISGVPSERLRNREPSDPAIRKIVRTVEMLPIIFISAADVASLREELKDFEDYGGADLVIVDDLQLIQKDPGEKGKHSSDEVLHALKKIAKKYKTPVVVLVNLSRTVEQRKDRHPRRKDLKNTGISKKNRDRAFLLYREYYYDPMAPRDSAELTGLCSGKGKKCSCKLNWNPETGVFRDECKKEE